MQQLCFDAVTDWWSGCMLEANTTAAPNTLPDRRNTMTTTDENDACILKLLYFPTVPDTFTQHCAFLKIKLLTFVYQLPPSLGPVSQLLWVGSLDFGTLLDAVHHVITEPMTIVNPFHCSFVVPNLKTNIAPLHYIHCYVSGRHITTC